MKNGTRIGRITRSDTDFFESADGSATRRAAPKLKFEGKYADLSEQIIGAFFQVHSDLGYGFNEKIYQRALAIALKDAGLAVVEQFPISVYYRGQIIGEYFADLVVNGVIILELKAANQIAAEHEAQLLNYLKATQFEVGYVLNFGRSGAFKRMIFDNIRKGSLQWAQR